MSENTVTNALTDFAGRQAMITDEEITSLLAVVQDGSRPDEVEAGVAEDGSPIMKTVWTTDAAAEWAMEKLVLAFRPSMRKIVKGRSITQVKPQGVVSEEDAWGVMFEAFIGYARKYDADYGRPFRHDVKQVLTRALINAERESDILRVSDSVRHKYNSLMAKHGKNEVGLEAAAVAAYAECKATNNNLAPETFLAAHHAMTGTRLSFDLLQDDNPAGDDVAANPIHDLEADLGVADDLIEAYERADLIRYLFSIVTPEQERICRLYYGFVDPSTENARLEHGYKWGERLSYAQIAPLVGIRGGKTVERRLKAALDVMRDAMTAIQNA